MSSYTNDPIPFEINGKEYHAKLSPMATIVVQEATGRSYATIMQSLTNGNLIEIYEQAKYYGFAIPDHLPPEPPCDPHPGQTFENLMQFCVACLLREWPGLTMDILFDALEMSIAPNYRAGLWKLYQLVVQLTSDYSPKEMPDDLPAGDEKNAEAPTTIPGVGEPSRETSTASSDIVKLKTTTRSGNSRSANTPK
jgi:hypothetical protein